MVKKKKFLPLHVTKLWGPEKESSLLFRKDVVRHDCDPFKWLKKIFVSLHWVILIMSIAYEVPKKVFHFYFTHEDWR